MKTVRIFFEERCRISSRWWQCSSSRLSLLKAEVNRAYAHGGHWTEDQVAIRTDAPRIATRLQIGYSRYSLDNYYYPASTIVKLFSIIAMLRAV